MAKARHRVKHVVSLTNVDRLLSATGTDSHDTTGIITILPILHQVRLQIWDLERSLKAYLRTAGRWLLPHFAATRATPSPGLEIQA